MYTIDTNAIIYYLKNDPVAIPILTGIFAEDIPLYISAITEIELFGFPSLEPGEAEEIETILETLISIPVDSRLARTAGMLRRAYSLKTPDSAIAATALITGTTLLTRNVGDFKKIPHMRVLRV